MEGTHTSLADRISGNIELATEAQRLRTVYDLLQTVAVNVPEGGMKKTRSNIALRTDHR